MSSVGEKNVISRGESSIPPQDKKESVCFLHGLVVSVLDAISTVLKKIASIFCCGINLRSNPESANLGLKKVDAHVVAQFEKACAKGNINEAEKFFEPLESSVLMQNGWLIHADPLSKGLKATFSGDPDTLDNRLALAKKILERNPSSRQTALLPAVMAADYEKFVPLILEHGAIDDNEKHLIIRELRYKLEHKKLTWFLNELNIDFTSSMFLSDLRILMKEMASPKRMGTLQDFTSVLNCMLDKCKNLGISLTYEDLSLPLIVEDTFKQNINDCLQKGFAIKDAQEFTSRFTYNSLNGKLFLIDNRTNE